MTAATAAWASVVVAAASDRLVGTTETAGVLVAPPVTAVTKSSISRRANASSDHASGGWAGAAGPEPRMGFSTQSTTLVTRLPTMASGFCGAAGVGIDGATSTVATRATAADFATLETASETGATDGCGTADFATSSLGVDATALTAAGLAAGVVASLGFGFFAGSSCGTAVTGTVAAGAVVS